MYPDVCIVDFDMKGLNGHEISEVIISDSLCPVMTMVKSVEQHYFVNLSREPSFTLLIKPLNRSTLLSTIEIMVKTAKSIRDLQKEVTDFKKKKDKNEIIEEAKARLMRHFSLTEDEAHKKLLKESMNRGYSKEMVARKMIDKYE